MAKIYNFPVFLAALENQHRRRIEIKTQAISVAEWATIKQQVKTDALKEIWAQALGASVAKAMDRYEQRIGLLPPRADEQSKGVQ